MLSFNLSGNLLLISDKVTNKEQNHHQPNIVYMYITNKIRCFVKQ